MGLNIGIAWSQKLSAALVRPIWVLFVRALLPKHVAHSLLEWQRSQSDRSAGLDKPSAELGRR